MRTSISVLAGALVCLMLVAAIDAQQEAPPAAAMPGQPAADAAGSPAVLSYAIGFNVGSNLRSSPVNVDRQSLVAGISDGLAGTAPKWSKEQLQAALQQFQLHMRQQAMNEAQQQAQANKQQADAFLAQNAQKEGVQTTASGLQYKVLRQGNGPSPTLNDVVKCHYRGTLLDGTEFDSSYGGDPAEFPVKGVIPGWTEALQKMRVGDKWQLFVPGDLAYGMNPPGPPLEPNSMLIFEVELLGINGQ